MLSAVITVQRTVKNVRIRDPDIFKPARLPKKPTSQSHHALQYPLGKVTLVTQAAQQDFKELVSVY